MVTTCLLFYSFEKIFEAKDLLCKAIGILPTLRRGENKAKSHLTDMMEILKRVDEQSISLLNILSDSHADMLPASGFKVISEHILEIISVMSTVKGKISLLEK